MWRTITFPPTVTTVIGLSNIALLIPNLSQNSSEINEVVAPVSNRTLSGLVRILSVAITACSELSTSSRVAQFSFPVGRFLLPLLFLPLFPPLLGCPFPPLACPPPLVCHPPGGFLGQSGLIWPFWPQP